VDRRWVRRVVIGVVAVLIVAVGIYGWAAASLQRSSIARAMWWRDADVGDQFRFPSRAIPAGVGSSSLPNGTPLDMASTTAPTGAGVEELLGDTDTLAFLVVHDDRLVAERYFGDAKSFLSTLVGIAIDEGAIHSVTDPVTDYVPELAQRDARFDQITLRNLLTMSSGIRYEEQSLPLPWGDDVNTYYGTDLRDLALNGTQIEQAPGQEWHYDNYNPLLLGLVLERATGMSVSEYMAIRLWQPLGAEVDATWSLDREDPGFEKMESGLNAAPVDYARFGELMLHGGRWNGAQIVSRGWAREATAAETSTDPAAHYQYFWWNDTSRPGRFYALGNLGQYIYVAPDADTVIVRFGADWGVSNGTWIETFRGIADQLAEGA
jgi:CubicO group peptidase (beta-lactamase class C family)